MVSEAPTGIPIQNVSGSQTISDNTANALRHHSQVSEYASLGLLRAILTTLPCYVNNDLHVRDYFNANKQEKTAVLLTHSFIHQAIHL